MALVPCRVCGRLFRPWRRAHRFCSRACTAHPAGRARPRGEAVHSAKLSAAAVQALRAQYARGGVTYVQLAARYGVSDRTVANAVARRTWRHVS